MTNADPVIQRAALLVRPEPQEEAARASAMGRHRLDLPAFARETVCIDQEYAAGDVPGGPAPRRMDEVWRANQ